MRIQQSQADQLAQAATHEISVGRISAAEALLNQVLELEPRHLMGLTRRAEVALLRKDHVRALALTDTALSIEANFAPAWHERAHALWLAGWQPEAVAASRRAVDIQPPNPVFRMRLAQFSAWTAQAATVHEAIAPMLASKDHDPAGYASAISLLGELAVAEGRFQEALPYLDQALRLQPSVPAIRMLRGMTLLRLGRLAEGWPDYAAREAIVALRPDRPPSLANAVWTGQDLAGKSLLVTDDQGHGDAIQFFRYLPLLSDRGAMVTWRTFPPLIRLFAEAAPYATVVNGVAEGVTFDFECNSTRLAQRFGTTLETIPATVPYLRSPASRRRSGRRLKVGLVWSGDTRHPRDHLRSIPASVFLALTRVPGVAFHSLQREVRPGDRSAVRGCPALRRDAEKAADFADTAALIGRLDLVITVDTAVAHLAGALGKPAWVILHVAPDWRWLADRADSPWYPATRLFRVTPAEWRGGAGWGPVIERVAAELRGQARRRV